ELVPACESDTLNLDSISPLSCLLTDSGGGCYLDALPWLEEGLRRIAASKLGVAKLVDWARDTWAAQMSEDHVKIYSLHDEEYAETIGLDAFEKALRAWTEFIQTPPDAKASRTIEI
ncbi:MAG: hypothetical protein WAM85_23305, partial [Terracidiphilus sp.]